jgi:hypothetical protein
MLSHRVPGELVEGTFNIRNVGKAPLEYQLFPSCGCVILTPLDGRIASSEFQPIRVGMKTLGYGQEKSVLIHLKTNDLSLVETDYRVTAFCPSPLETTPSVINLGRIPPAVEKNIRLTVAYKSAQSYAMTTSNHERIGMHRISSKGLVDEWDLRIHAGSKIGFVTDQIRIDIEGYSVPMTIPIVGEIVDEMIISPSYVALMKKQRGKGYRDVILIASRRDGEPFGRIDRIDKPDHILFHEIDREESIKRRRIRVEFRGDHPQDLSEPSIVRFYFMGMKRPVVVRFQPCRDR